MLSKKSLVVALALFINSPLGFADEYLNCSAANSCAFTVSPEAGWHVKLMDISKGYKYTCAIKGIAYVFNLDTATASNEGITDLILTQIDGMDRTLTFNTSNLNVVNGYITFNAQNNSDTPESESISCSEVSA